MSENRLLRPPTLRKRLSVPFMTGSAIVFLVMLALPVSQMVSGPPEAPPNVVDTTLMNGPQDIPPEPPKPEPPKDEPIDKIEEDVIPPPLNVIEIYNNPDMSNFGNGGYEVNFRDFTKASIDDAYCPWDELTRAPQPIRQPAPLYPNDLKQMGIEGEVILTFLVRADGTTTKVRVERSSNPGFEQPAVRSVRKWVFNPGEKDGRVVSTTVRISIPFRIHSTL